MTHLASLGTARRRRAAALVSLAACTAAGLVVAAALTPRPPARPLMPNPNGYDDIVRAGGMVFGTVPNRGEWWSADLNELRAYVEANQPALDRARVGLGRRTLAPLAHGHGGLDRSMAQTEAIRTLSRLMLAEARVVREGGDPVAAANSSFRAAELGQVATQGGLPNAVLTGWVVERQALDQLGETAERLPLAELRAGLTRLADLDRRCVAVADVLAEEDRWYEGAYPGWQRFLVLRGARAKAVAAILPTHRAARDRVVRAIHTTSLAWAARLFELENGRKPRSAAELVPAILPAVPLDPATAKPMDLPAAPAAGSAQP